MLNDNLFVIRRHTRRHIEVYDARTFALRRRVPVAGLGSVSWGLASCAADKCLYVSDWSNRAVHRVVVTAAILDGFWRRLARPKLRRWRIDAGNPLGLSVNRLNNVIVACWSSVSEYTTRGSPVRTISLQPERVDWIQHAVQLDDDRFVICHADIRLHRVCLVDGNGLVVAAYGEERGPGRERFNNPTHLAIDRNGFVFVADGGNGRIKVLNPSTGSSSELLPTDANCELRMPSSVHLDEANGRLFVGENSGRFHVFDFVRQRFGDDVTNQFQQISLQVRQ
jgi:DNA-binding beta-propeller fold protein YncE